MRLIARVRRRSKDDDALVIRTWLDPATASPRRTPAWKRRERRLSAVLSIPALLPFTLFVILPIFYALFLSFTEYNGFLTPEWVGLDNYRAVLGDDYWWQSVRNTFVLAFGQMVIEIPLALMLAVFLNRNLRFTGLFRTVFFLPHVISVAVMGVVFYFLFRPLDGVINELLQTVGLIGDDIDWLGSGDTAMLSLILVAVWFGFGVNTILFLVGLQTIPKEIYESASIDGAGSWRLLRSITLPLLTPILRVIVMLSIVFSMRTFDLVKTLTNGGPAGETDVMFTYLFNYYFGGLDRGSQYGYASALAVVASLIIAAISLIYLFFSRDRKDATA